MYSEYVDLYTVKYFWINQTKKSHMIVSFMNT